MIVSFVSQLPIISQFFSPFHQGIRKKFMVIGDTFTFIIRTFLGNLDFFFYFCIVFMYVSMRIFFNKLFSFSYEIIFLKYSFLYCSKIYNSINQLSLMKPVDCQLCVTFTHDFTNFRPIPLRNKEKIYGCRS